MPRLMRPREHGSRLGGPSVNRTSRPRGSERDVLSDCAPRFHRRGRRRVRNRPRQGFADSAWARQVGPRRYVRCERSAGQAQVPLAGCG